MIKRYFLLVAIAFVSALFSGCSRVSHPATSTTQSAAVSPAELETFIVQASQPGGKLDFFTPIKGHEYEGRLLKPGVYATGLEFALYSWGNSVHQLGVKSIEQAYSLYATVKGRPASEREKDTIKLGFQAELDH